MDVTELPGRVTARAPACRRMHAWQQVGVPRGVRNAAFLILIALSLPRNHDPFALTLSHHLKIMAMRDVRLAPRRAGYSRSRPDDVAVSWIARPVPLRGIWPTPSLAPRASLSCSGDLCDGHPSASWASKR